MIVHPSTTPPHPNRLPLRRSPSSLPLSPCHHLPPRHRHRPSLRSLTDSVCNPVIHTLQNLFRMRSPLMPRQYACRLMPLYASLYAPPWTATTTPRYPSTHSGPHARRPTTYPRVQAHSQHVAVAPYASHTVPTNPGPGRHVSASPARLDHGVWGHARYGHREPGPHFRAAWDGLAGVWGPGRCACATGHVSVHAGSTRRPWQRMVKRELATGRCPGGFSQPKVVGPVADMSWGMPKGMGTSSGIEDALL